MHINFFIIYFSDKAELALTSHPEEVGSAPQVNLSLNQKLYEVYSNELDIDYKSFKFGAKQGNHDLKFAGKTNFSNEKYFARLQGSTNNNPMLFDIRGGFRPRSTREIDFKVVFKQSKIVEISFKPSFKEVYGRSKSGGVFQIKANGESKVDIKFEEEEEREIKLAMTSKIPNFEKVEMALKATTGKV